MKISIATLIALGAVSTLHLVANGVPVPDGCAVALDSNGHCPTITEKFVYDERKRGVSMSLAKHQDLADVVDRLLPRVAPKFGETGGGDRGKPGDNNGFTDGSSSGRGQSSGDGKGGASTVGAPTLGKTPDTGHGTTASDPPPPGNNPVVPTRFVDGVREAARSRGQGVQQGLDDAIAQKLPDVNKGVINDYDSRVFGNLNYQRGPSEKTGELPIQKWDGSDKSNYLQEFGIDGSIASKWKNAQITNRGENLAPILEYGVSKDQGAMIIDKAYAIAHDANRIPGSGAAVAGVTDNEIMKLKDIMMDCWRDGVRITQKDGPSIPGDVRNLKFIVRNDVATPDSQAAIDAAFSLTGRDRKLSTRFSSTSTDPNELAAFQEIAGTVHGAGIIKMLADHHNELEDLRVMSFGVVTKDTLQPGYYAIIAEIGRN